MVRIRSMALVAVNATPDQITLDRSRGDQRPGRTLRHVIAEGG
jgi:hypothetical protein